MSNNFKRMTIKYSTIFQIVTKKKAYNCKFVNFALKILICGFFIPLPSNATSSSPRLLQFFRRIKSETTLISNSSLKKVTKSVNFKSANHNSMESVGLNAIIVVVDMIADVGMTGEGLLLLL